MITYKVTFQKNVLVHTSVNGMTASSESMTYKEFFALDLEVFVLNFNPSEYPNRVSKLEGAGYTWRANNAKGSFKFTATK